MKLTMTDVKLTDDRLRTLPQRLEKAAQAHVDRTAFWIEGQAKVNAPVDTGFLRSSIYTETAGSSGYDRALHAAERLDVKRHAGQRKSAAGQWVDVAGSMMGEVEAPGNLAANVIVGAEYGIHVEYGTMFAPAQPFLTPAFEAAREHVARLAVAVALPFLPERVGSWWDRVGEVDVLALSDAEGAMLLGECKWAARPVGTNILDDLKRKAALVDPTGQWPRVTYALWSKSGFTSALREQAAAEGALLVTADELVAG